MVRTWLCIAIAAASACATARADDRQKYGPWELNKEKGYHFRKYEFKANPTDKEFKHEYVLYFKDDPKKKNWIYFYNPQTEKVWARYPTVNNPEYGKDVAAGKELWAILPAKERKKYVDEIPATAYPAPSAKECPYVPGAKDKCQIQLPPSDLP